jgi:hypothetical protein
MSWKKRQEEGRWEGRIGHRTGKLEVRRRIHRGSLRRRDCSCCLQQ